jgi:N-acetylmuramic acid 6-phosphate etherase
MISTGAMVRIGKTLGNRMVDLRPTNEKLRIRSRRMLRELAGIDDARAVDILARCGGRLKTALVVAMADVGPDAAQELLEAHGGQVRAAVSAALGASSPPSPRGPGLTGFDDRLPPDDPRRAPEEEGDHLDLET